MRSFISFICIPLLLVAINFTQPAYSKLPDYEVVNVFQDIHPDLQKQMRAILAAEREDLRITLESLGDDSFEARKKVRTAHEKYTGLKELLIESLGQKKPKDVAQLRNQLQNALKASHSNIAQLKKEDVKGAYLEAALAERNLIQEMLRRVDDIHDTLSGAKSENAWKFPGAEDAHKAKQKVQE